MAVGVNKSIYVFGGYTDRHKEVTYLDTAARFDTLTGSWTFLSPMEYARSGGQVTIIFDNDKEVIRQSNYRQQIDILIIIRVNSIFKQSILIELLKVWTPAQPC